MTRRLIAGLALAVALPAAAPAQEAGTELVDRIVAVVGDSAILASDIQVLIERRRAFGQPVPTDPEALDELRRQELETLINEMILLQAAERDSVVVAPEEVEAQVQATLTEQERRFGGRAAFEAALQAEGLTLQEYRQTVASGVRRAGVRQQFEATLMRDRTPPTVSDAEVREFFEARRAELGRRPATIRFQQAVVTPEPSDSARQAALDEAQRALDAIREGEDFGTVARRYSDDLATREQGGELGWFRRGRMVPEFERAAYALRPGQTSGIVETSFGFHIIRLDRIRGPERQARHILIRPEITATDRERTQDRAREAAAKLRAGASMDSVIDAIHDPAEQSRIGPALQDSLPTPYRSQLRGVSTGEVVGPFQIPDTQDAYAVVKVTDATAAGEYTLQDEEMRVQIRQFLQREKLMQEVLGELRERTYIDVRY